METRKLGSEGPEFTTIGFGCWAMGGGGWVGSWGDQDDRDSIRSIETAYHEGINWFDTAAVYGLGHSEEVLGKGLGKHRKDVYIATKFGSVWDEKGTISDHASYESVLKECDASLRRLGTDYIDLYQQHWPDRSGTPIEETMRALTDLVQQGKVRWVGVSNYDKTLLSNALSVRHIDSLQPPYSLFNRAAETELLPYCQDKGVGVVAYSPLASGLLGGKYTPDKKFEEGDWRANSDEFRGEGLRRNLEKVERLREIAERFDKTVPQLAIAWVLSNPALTSAIIGVRRPDHMTSILPAADWKLDAGTLAEIDTIMENKVVVNA